MFLEPGAAYERQQSIDYFDLLLILDFKWFPLFLQLPERTIVSTNKITEFWKGESNTVWLMI